MENLYKDVELWKQYIIDKGMEHGFNIVTVGVDGVAFNKGNVTVIASINRELDNNTWVHLSMSRSNKYIPYEEIKYIKEVFIGKDKEAIQVFPEEKNHVNIHKYCFHLWFCASCKILPDFTHGFRSI